MVIHVGEVSGDYDGLFVLNNAKYGDVFEIRSKISKKLSFFLGSFESFGKVMDWIARNTSVLTRNYEEDLRIKAAKLICLYPILQWSTTFTFVA